MHVMKLGVVFVVITLSACEQKSPRDDQRATPKTDEAPPTQPSPDPSPAARKAATPPQGGGSAEAPGGDDVRKPIAGDLATYMKDIPGTGTKLQMTMETSLGTLHCDMFTDKAPMTIANFVGLATGKKPWSNPKTGNVEKGKPYFDGLTFHRVIPGFMIQGGDPLGQGTGGPGYNFQDEFADGLEMGPGTLAMANAGKGPDGGGTNGSQFFVMEGARPDLVGKHTIFGHCAELDVVKKITSTPRDDNDKPNTTVTITKVTFKKS